VAFLRWGGGLKVDLCPSSESDIFRYTWIDLTRSAERSSGTLKGGAVRELHAPEDYPGTLQYKDWVVHIVRQQKPGVAD
jgi:hypothetical protein